MKRRDRLCIEQCTKRAGVCAIYYQLLLSRARGGRGVLCFAQLRPWRHGCIPVIQERVRSLCARPVLAPGNRVWFKVEQERRRRWGGVRSRTDRNRVRRTLARQRSRAIVWTQCSSADDRRLVARHQCTRALLRVQAVARAHSTPVMH